MCHKMNDNMVFACNTSVSLFGEVTEIDFLVELVVALAVKEHCLPRGMSAHGQNDRHP